MSFRTINSIVLLHSFSQSEPHSTCVEHLLHAQREAGPCGKDEFRAWGSVQKVQKNSGERRQWLGIKSQEWAWNSLRGRNFKADHSFSELVE